MKDTLELQKFYPEEIGITEVTQNEKEIYIHVSVQSKNCTCPKCGVTSEHKHGTYKRKLQDLPILGRTTYLIVNAYEYQCDNSSCDVTTFVENVDGFLNYYSRMTVSAKYCYAAHESRLHQNDRCKRFALCLVLTVRFRSLAPWGKLFQLFI